MKRRIKFKSATYVGGVKLFTRIPHGHGRVEYTNGDSYEGDWKAGHRTGRGIYRYAGGDVYEGEFLNDKPHGRGKKTHAADGEIYEGEWRDGQRHGFGKSTYPDGTTIEAFYSMGVHSGPAQIIFPNGRIYQGPISGSRIKGFGYLVFPDDTTIEGEWDGVDTVANAVYTDANGKKTRGRVENGKFIPEGE